VAVLAVGIINKNIWIRANINSRFDLHSFEPFERMKALLKMLKADHNRAC